MNALLSCAFVFSIVVAFTGAKALTEMFLK